MDYVEKAKNGDKNTFNELINANKMKIYKTAKSILKDEDDVCDAIQDALLRAYNNIHKLKDNQYFTTWIIRIVINRCYDISKINQKNKSKIINIEEAKELETYDKYDESTLTYVLDRIDYDLKVITTLFYYDDLSVKEISDILNIPEGTVKSRLARARSAIYEILKKEGDYYAK